MDDASKPNEETPETSAEEVKDDEVKESQSEPEVQAEEISEEQVKEEPEEVSEEKEEKPEKQKEEKSVEEKPAEPSKEEAKEKEKPAEKTEKKPREPQSEPAKEEEKPPVDKATKEEKPAEETPKEESGKPEKAEEKPGEPQSEPAKEEPGGSEQQPKKPGEEKAGEEKAEVEEETVKIEPKKEEAKKKEGEKDDFKYIVRIANTDVDGGKTVVRGLTSIKGVGMRMSVLITDAAGVNRNIKIGDLTDAQIDKIKGVLDNVKNNAPKWMLNHRKDYETGEDIHLVGPDIDMRLRDEINIMKKIRSYRGVRHERGLRVRGQRTRANSRQGLSLGVSKKSAQAAAARSASSKKE